MSTSNASVQQDDQPNLIAVMVRFTPTVFAAIKSVSRQTAVPVSILVRQVMADWIDGGASTSK